MRIIALLAAIAAFIAAAPADAQGRGRPAPQRDQDAAYHAMQQGDILPLPVILSRVRVRGAQFIGADLNSTGTVYRLTYMRGSDVVRVLVDARTGRPLGISR
ncbi:MAG TPA: hypothetical protein VF577_04095 [Allosphingosinicella sp.]|jgi:hypothetical protein